MPAALNRQATTLCTLHGLHCSLGTLLADAMAQRPEACDTDVGGCGQSCPVTYALLAAPRNFTLQAGLEWGRLGVVDWGWLAGEGYRVPLDHVHGNNTVAYESCTFRWCHSCC